MHVRLCMASISRSVHLPLRSHYICNISHGFIFARRLDVISMDRVERCSFRSDCNSLFNAGGPAKHAPNATRAEPPTESFRKRRQKKACYNWYSIDNWSDKTVLSVDEMKTPVLRWPDAKGVSTLLSTTYGHPRLCRPREYPYPG